jgi:hypothetical protein
MLFGQTSARLLDYRVECFFVQRSAFRSPRKRIQ